MAHSDRFLDARGKGVEQGKPAADPALVFSEAMGQLCLGEVMPGLELAEHGRLLEQIPLTSVAGGGQHVEDGFAFIAVPDMGREGVPPTAPGCLQPQIAIDEGEAGVVGGHDENRNQLTIGSERDGESCEAAIIPDAGVGKSRIDMDDLDRLYKNRGVHVSPLPWPGEKSSHP